MSDSHMWEIYVPCKWNGGKPVSTRHHREWDKRVRKLSGGLTILHPAKGQWVSASGELFEERMIPVRVWCTPAQIKKIMDITAQHYKQHAVLAYRVSSEVLYSAYSEEGAKNG